MNIMKEVNILLKFDVKSKRVKKDIKQGEFAKRIGITPQYLRLIEKGEIDPRRSLMVKIAKELDTTVQELFFSEDE